MYKCATFHLNFSFGWFCGVKMSIKCVRSSKCIYSCHHPGDLDGRGASSPAEGASPPDRPPPGRPPRQPSQPLHSQRQGPLSGLISCLAPHHQQQRGVLYKAQNNCVRRVGRVTFIRFFSFIQIKHIKQRLRGAIGAHC